MSMELLDVAVRRGRYVPRPVQELRELPESTLIKAGSHQWGAWQAPERPSLLGGVEILKVPTIADIKSLMYQRYGISPVQLIAQQRTKRLSDVRQIAMYLSCKLTPHSLVTIGAHFGDRDHTTVMHARDRLDERRLVDPDFDVALKTMEMQLGANARWPVPKVAKPRIRVSEETKKAILQSYINGERVTVIGRKYGVHATYSRRLAKLHGIAPRAPHFSIPEMRA